MATSLLSIGPRTLMARLLLSSLAVLALAPAAHASVGVGSNAAAPSLRVDAKGNAEVSYTVDKERRTVLVPLTGELSFGGTLAGRDVSRASKTTLPYAKVVRSGPHGWTYA